MSDPDRGTSDGRRRRAWRPSRRHASDPPDDLGKTPQDPGTYAQRVGRSVELQLGEMVGAYDDETLLADLGPPDSLAACLLRALPMPSPWNDTIGPFYDSRQIAAVLGGISRQALAERRRRRTLLALRTADGVYVYPTFQVDDRGMIREGLSELVKAFDPDSVDPWTIAGWLVAGQRALEGMTPIAWLVAKRDAATLLTLARDANRRLAA